MKVGIIRCMQTENYSFGKRSAKTSEFWTTPTKQAAFFGAKESSPVWIGGIFQSKFRGFRSVIREKIFSGKNVFFL